MLALSPPLFSSFGWPLDDQTAHIERNNCIGNDPFLIYNREIETSESFLRCGDNRPDAEFEDLRHLDSTGDDPSTTKKISHNANERDRRKKLNNLYSTLRSLMPGTDETKKLSIPATVSRALKYIPELQKQMERLIKRKEEILSQIMKQGYPTHLKNNGVGPAQVSPSDPTVSVCQVDDTHVVIQMCVSDVSRNPISTVLMNLEEEGNRVVNASTFSSVDKVFYNVHLQVNEVVSMQNGLLKEKLISLYGSKKILFPPRTM
ncbi:transcription factor bHLH100-like [Magnolia sinica]|uniref:transcription factor bHLH100-like n=1 Tax=Magnolia sinica TaxID=86752 RepID=UPI0026596777|nr:transcription factor bHLH100-like [Magnolia sinica]